MNGIYAVDTDILKDKEIFARLYDRMPQYRKDKTDSMKPEASKRLSLGAGIVLDRALADLGLHEYEVEEEERGKPFLKGCDNVFFNISHSGNAAVCAVSDRNIGVDIEKIRSFDNGLINYVFDEEEVNYVRRNSADDAALADEFFTRLWTIKESVMKYFGRGISMEPKKLHVTQGEKTMVSCVDCDCGGLNFFFYEINDMPLTICTEYNDFTDNVIYITEK